MSAIDSLVARGLSAAPLKTIAIGPPELAHRPSNAICSGTSNGRLAEHHGPCGAAILLEKVIASHSKPPSPALDRLGRMTVCCPSRIPCTNWHAGTRVGAGDPAARATGSESRRAEIGSGVLGRSARQCHQSVPIARHKDVHPFARIRPRRQGIGFSDRQRPVRCWRAAFRRRERRGSGHPWPQSRSPDSHRNFRCAQRRGAVPGTFSTRPRQGVEAAPFPHPPSSPWGLPEMKLVLAHPMLALSTPTTEWQLTAL